MANATKRMATKTREKIVEEVYTELDGVTLTLDDEEAAFLSALLYTRITGQGETRRLSDNISTALNKAGYRSPESLKVRTMITKMSGYVNIKEPF